MLKLLNEPRYSGIIVQKIEDINRWCKKMYYRLEKKRKEMKNVVIDG